LLRYSWTNSIHVLPLKDQGLHAFRCFVPFKEIPFAEKGGKSADME
jgi:hypothetical protein